MNTTITTARAVAGQLIFAALGLLSTFLLIDPFADDKSITVAWGYFLAVALTITAVRKQVLQLAVAASTDVRRWLDARKSRSTL